jgi:hypothetical protein
MKALSIVQLSVVEFFKLVQNHRDLYEAIFRNGYYLPKLKSTMITEKYMRKVVSGKAYCLKYTEVKMLPCNL